MTKLASLAAIGAFALLGVGNGVAVAEPGDGALRWCPPHQGQKIAISVGTIDCESAAYYTDQYDPNGNKFQTIGPFTCYSSNAFTVPLIFTCVSKEPEAEFGVYPA